MVDREPQLIAVPALQPAAIAGDRRADAGVVDQCVQARDLAAGLLGERAHLLERGEVGAQPTQPLVAGRGADLLDRLASALIVAAVEQERRVLLRELSRQRASEPVRGAGDQDCLLTDRSDRDSCWSLRVAGDCARRRRASGTARGLPQR